MAVYGKQDAFPVDQIASDHSNILFPRQAGRLNAKHGSGTVGYLTDGMIDRALYYEHALLLALIPWVRPDGSGADASGLFNTILCGS
jgi:hypothetical protein